MCGIAAVLEQDETVRTVSCRRIVAAITHRGSAACQGESTDDGRFHVSLRTNRLPIQGPADGRQPMESVDGAVLLVFNGEIYNLSLIHI